MRPIPMETVSCGKVLRGFNSDGGRVKAGTILTHEQLSKMPRQNRDVMVEKNWIILIPKDPMNSAKPSQVSPPAVADGQPQRHLVSLGFGRFDVIEGVKLNEKPLRKKEAEALAGVKSTKKGGKKSKAAKKRKTH